MTGDLIAVVVGGVLGAFAMLVLVAIGIFDRAEERADELAGEQVRCYLLGWDDHRAHRAKRPPGGED